MSTLTIGTNLKLEASTSQRPFFEPIKNTHSARSSISHPQLRDLLICPTQAHHVQTVSGHGVDAHVFGQYTMRLMDNATSFHPNCLVSGCGYVAIGGSSADLLIRSVDIHSRWELKVSTGQSIVNSVHFFQASPRGNPQVLVCNNDQTITQYDLSSVSTIQNAASESLSVDPAHRPTPGSRSREADGDNLLDPPVSTGNEKPVLTHKSSIIFPVPVNHCSVSPDSKTMVAVGDSSEVFIYDCQNAHQSNEPLIGDWRLGPRKIYLPGVSALTGSFSTSWNQYGDKFAVASEGEVVVVYDMKMLGKPLLVKQTAQKGRPGGARVVKFSPAGPNELLAFTEHQSLVHVLDARTFDPDHEEILTVPTPFPGMTPFPPRLSPGSIRTHQSTSSPARPSSLLDRSSLIYDEENASSASRRMSELHAQLSRGARRNFRPIEMDLDIEPEEHEQDDEDNPDAEPNRRNRLRRRNRQSGSPASREEPITEMSFAEPMFGEFSGRRSPELDTVGERMWGAAEERNDLNLGSSLTSRGSQLFGTGIRASRTQRGYSWAVRSRLQPNLEDDDACLEGEGGEQGSQARPNNSLSRTTSAGTRLEWGPPSTSTSSSRQIQLNGSSIRVLSVDDDRSSRVDNNSTNTPSSTTAAILRARVPAATSIAQAHSQLIANRLGQNPPPFSRSEAWFDLDGGGPPGAIRNRSNSLYGLISSSYSGVRSGMWDDLIGLSWSPDGDWLVSGTEVALVEWKVKRSSRAGFGDSRLC
ncbi:hypothetical protein PGT21_017625 [Puccinia graminis f. sp. tritici]|uniref:DUF2415 domain-containing protein n=1 Tax=Puccinia graminis f. sp. tritici TaxID=56615 RepID=A0A5B0RIQ8_PUCGR|nr:hypothetical protein PGT21_017625 [Puccinia graminis f. sp. tritici]KAA1124664.1 hypothetical protein PGTUg99_027591 [Puccinia graminis f. sp. tritici]